MPGVNAMTAPLEPRGDRVAQVLQCNVCGHRTEDLSREGAMCQMTDPAHWPHRAAPCPGYYVGMRVVKV